MAETTYESIVLGGGCFWCLDAAYRLVDGVTDSLCGYAGGDTPDPSYELVSADVTGHAEVVEVTFDPQKISLADILAIFWGLHDPTTLNRQGNDVGSQYRSAIYYTSQSQKAVIDASLKAAAGSWSDPLTTEVAPLDHFYVAEPYHQDYFNKNPEAGYCQVIINPKLAHFRQAFAQHLKSAT
jgi:methionine-S-sulfoxide reductase